MMGTFPTEYVSKGNSLWSTIMSAYFPQSIRYWAPGRLAGAPPWMTKENYDIEAKLDETTIQEWKSLTVAQRQEKLRPMLQAMLAERCKLVAHTVPAEIPGFSLVVEKHGAKFHQSKPDTPAPSGGVALPAGGWIVPHARGAKPELTLVNVSMATVAEFVMTSGERPVQDKTGLTGRYDLVIPPREGLSSSDPDPSSEWQVEDLGLELKPAKIPTVTVVIDHLERPSEN